jgi:hypothetical protein
MPGAHWVTSLLVLGTLVSGCGDAGSSAPAPSGRGTPGGPSISPSAAPGRPMDDVERPVADRLAPRLEDDGLTLEYVDCPDWSGAVPASLQCRAFVDGVVAPATVQISREDGSRLVFDAWLDHGVVSTARLVERLEAQGYAEVDCGEVPAYPARAGTRIMCEVDGGAGAGHVVATVVDARGHVRIEDY